MKHDGVWVVNDPHAILPNAGAVIRISITDIEGINQSIKLLKYTARRQEERAGAVVHVAPEHVGRRKRIIAAPIRQTRAISPNDVACLLERAVDVNNSAADNTNIRGTLDRR